MNKADFLRELTDKRAEWDALLAQIPQEQMDVPGVNSEGWSVKDIVAHVAWYENEATYILKSHTLTSENPENDKAWSTSIDERNRFIYEQNRDRSLDEVLAEGQKAYAAFLQQAQSLTDEDLNDASRYEGMPEDWTPGDVVASNTYEHYPDHVTELRAWLAKAGKS